MTWLWIFLHVIAIDYSEKKVGNVSWMMVFRLWPSKLRCPPMRTVLLRKRYRSQKHLWSAQMLSDFWKWWLFVISNENVSDSMHFSSLINLLSCKSWKIAILMSGHEIYKSRHKICKKKFLSLTSKFFIKDNLIAS